MGSDFTVLQPPLNKSSARGVTSQTLGCRGIDYVEARFTHLRLRMPPKRTRPGLRRCGAAGMQELYQSKHESGDDTGGRHRRNLASV